MMKIDDTYLPPNNGALVYADAARKIHIGDFVCYSPSPCRYFGYVWDLFNGTYVRIASTNSDLYCLLNSIYPNTPKDLYVWESLVTDSSLRHMTLEECKQLMPEISAYKAGSYTVTSEEPAPIPVREHIIGIDKEEIDKDAYNDFMRNL